MVSRGGVQAVEAVFLLLLVFVAMFAGLARRLKVPYPILLVIAGLLVSFLPGMPRIGLDPDLVFLVFLPPLLYAAIGALFLWLLLRSKINSAWIIGILIALTGVSIGAAASITAHCLVFDLFNPQAPWYGCLLR